MVVLIGAFGACGGSEPQMATGDGVSPPPGAASLSITAQKETLEAVGVARWDIYLPPWSQDWSRLEAIAIGVNAFGARIEKLRIVANRDAAGNGWIDAEAFSGGQWGEKLVINQPTGMAHAESPLGERTRALWVHLSKDSEAHAATVDDLGTMSLGTAYGECGCGGKAAKFW
ncbi:MAG TPA: hypothetical protein VMZ28_05715, partial [Kofleriaceae bacterium]|nr:hypothetical protein [Kofleriaceae bacterium]